MKIEVELNIVLCFACLKASLATTLSCPVPILTFATTSFRKLAGRWERALGITGLAIIISPDQSGQERGGSMS